MEHIVDVLTYIAIGVFIAIMLFEWRQRFRRYCSHGPNIAARSSSDAKTVLRDEVAKRTSWERLTFPKGHEIKRPVILWLAAGSVLTWWSGYGFGTYYFWSTKHIHVIAAFALAIVPALVFEAIVHFWEAISQK